MIRQYQNIIGTPLLHFEKGNTLGYVQDIIIDPDRAKVEGFWIKSMKSSVLYPIIQTQDILEWKKNIYIRNEKVMSDPADIVRIREVLNKERLIVGNRVQNENGKPYGTVFNLSFNDNTYYLRDIHVQKRFLGFSYHTRIFSSSNIIEVLEKAIIIDDDGRKKKPIINPIILNKDVADAGGLNRLERSKKEARQTL